MEPFRLELPTGISVGSVNAYLFAAPEPILVDTGIRGEESWSALEEGLSLHGLAAADISRIVLTHAHVDHFGQAGAIVAQGDAEVWISEPGARRLLADETAEEQRLRFYRDHFLPSTGLPPESMAIARAGLDALAAQSYPIPPGSIHVFDLDGVLQMGGRPWKVIYTPGHTSTQTCFYDPHNRLLLSGDMLLATTPTPVVETPADGKGERVPALPLFLESLDKLYALEIDLVLPGHGRPFDDHRAVIDRQRSRIEQRKLECLQWIEAGYHVTADLLPKMYPHQPAGLNLTGLWMLVGYLDLLLADGAIRRENAAGVYHYYATS